MSQQPALPRTIDHSNRISREGETTLRTCPPLAGERTLFGLISVLSNRHLFPHNGQSGLTRSASKLRRRRLIVAMTSSSRRERASSRFPPRKNKKRKTRAGLQREKERAASPDRHVTVLTRPPSSPANTIPRIPTPSPSISVSFSILGATSTYRQLPSFI